MTNLSVVFNGYDLSQVMRITDIKRSIGNSRSVSTNDAPAIGVNVHEIKIGPKTIKVGFTLKGTNLESVKHELAGVFRTDEVARLTFSDEPDKYYLALVIGEIEPDNVRSWYQKGEIEFLIPDGVAHSTAYKRFDNPREENGKLVFDLVNNGNVPAPPIITIKHNSENGYIGIINQNNALEIGDREEADTETYKRSEILFDYVSDNGIVKGFAQGQKNTAILNDLSQSLDTQLYIKNEFGRPHLAMGSRGAGSGPHHAGSITWEIPLDSSSDRGALNEYIWWRQIFWAGSVMQKGFIKLTVSDTEGRFLYGVETFKRGNGVDSEFNLLVSDGRSGYKILRSWPFKCTHLDSDNPFNAERGWADILRRDDMLQVHWWGSYPQFYVPEIKGRKSAKIHVALGALGSHPHIHHMYLDSIVYRKDFVTGTVDVPNRFQIGSTVVLDVEKDLVTIDGLPANHQVVDGSGWNLTIPPGKSQLEILLSSFIQKTPTVSVNIEERHL
ncbi:distal tail protein Dit [Streptococcus suis]|uniref:distal tail protein Dit n=1 Tax=Streptococcus suis TaxID=1307 RepID=UPI0005CD12C7|nr:distal tail protein Dit [Streptococcus suis]NQF93116.1 phage tail family protein [Streptococcus suis]NQH06207.1 phage tail family protein [Streptococcus suis]NQH13791.1 phage tail family protein [Streptococcus suis]NQQ19403.1 phage tail family protein [Streptococcus suis]NQQ42690.1 phage tail family protein [Streptococcus suis]